MKFPDKPNARNVMGEPVTISDDGHFRIQEIIGSGWYAHRKRVKKDNWSGIPGQPFKDRTEAIAACRAAGVPEKKRTRAVRIHADSVI